MLNNQCDVSVKGNHDDQEPFFCGGMNVKWQFYPFFLQ